MTTKLHPGFQFKVFIHLIRALFPRWSFFDQVAYNFEIAFKVPNALNWETLTFQKSRQPFSLFINPDANESLAHVNIIEHFAKDVQDLQVQNPLIRSKDVQKLTSFKLLKSVLEVKVQDYDAEIKTIQFKIVARNSEEILDIYISDWLQLEQV